jgi:hypothetical protein
MLKRVRVAFGAALLVPAVAAGPASAEDAAPVVIQQRVAASDGVELQTTLTSAGPVQAKPTVVEFSPYGRNTQTLTVGPDYNFSWSRSAAPATATGPSTRSARRARPTSSTCCSGRATSRGAMAISP